MSKRKIFFQVAISILFLQGVYSQNPSNLYQNWLDAQTSGATPTLPTFSYAGYKNGEVNLPSSFTQQIYDVTSSPFNAIPNDDVSDKPAIMAAIKAAEANPDGGIVFFPPGRFIINDAVTDNRNELIKITKSNIVLKGSGSGKGGTELYQKDNTEHPEMASKPWICPYLIQFTNNEDSQNTYITNVTADATRESFTVQVENTSNINVGQWIELYIRDNSPALIAEELSPYSVSDLFNPNNLDIVKNGVHVREIHKVVSKTINTITFKEPLHKTIDASYDWSVNNFKVLEEVGIQDLKYTGGYIYDFLHHQAPHELYPGEAVNGPHAYLSDSGWSGIQFNHVVNGWINNVEFSNMSQTAQFKFSGYCTAINNIYTGKPGHTFISANTGTGNFIGKNKDNTTGIWHGTGVTGASIANVLWRNEHPTNGNSGMEIHASQPRSTLFDVCQGGMFSKQGGATSSLPNHLSNLVLWNFNGASYKDAFVKSWRPNSETNFTKFILPIISGLKGFTMSTATNQFLVNESEGNQVDETSLYEHQLAYRLGTLPNWLTDIENKKILYSEDFSENLTRGYTRKVINNGGHPDQSNLMKSVADIPDDLDSNDLFEPNKDREAIRIPNGNVRNQKTISISGTKDEVNYSVNAYAVFTTLDLSKSNSIRENEDDYVYATFWTQKRYGDGDIANINIEISTDYSGAVLDATWTVLPLVSGKLSNNSDNRNFVKGMVDLTAYANGVHGTNITLALHYQGSSKAWSSTNRNGTFYISDLQFITQSSPITNTWSGRLNSDFNNPENWEEKVVPASNSNTIEIPAGLKNYPTVTSSLTLNKITIASGATFIANNTINANVIYKRTLRTPVLTGNNIDDTEGWHLVASPVSSETYNSQWAIANGIATSSSGNLAIGKFNDTNNTDKWEYSDGSQSTFLTGKGYRIKRNSTGNISFEGKMNTTNIDNVNLISGYNLVGNPFTAYIDNMSFLNLASNTSLLDSKTIWIWNSETKNYEAKLSGDNPSFKIAPGQGFFVKSTTSGNLSFKANTRSHQENDTFFKNASSLNPEITLNIISDDVKRFTKIRYLDEATDSFDNGLDGKTFTGIVNELDVFSQLLDNNTGEKYQIQAIHNANYKDKVIPIGIVTNSDRELIFSVDATHIPEEHNVYLEDKSNNKITILSNLNSTYKTTVSGTETLGRFFVHLKTASALSTRKNTLTNVHIFKTEKNRLRFIGLPNEKISLTLYNLQGINVLNSTFRASINTSLTLPKLSRGVYMIKLKTKKGELYKKIIL